MLICSSYHHIITITSSDGFIVEIYQTFYKRLLICYLNSFGPKKKKQCFWTQPYEAGITLIFKRNQVNIESNETLESLFYKNKMDEKGGKKKFSRWVTMFLFSPSLWGVHCFTVPPFLTVLSKQEALRLCRGDDEAGATGGSQGLCGLNQGLRTGVIS